MVDTIMIRIFLVVPSTQNVVAKLETVKICSVPYKKRVLTKNDGWFRLHPNDSDCFSFRAFLALLSTKADDAHTE